MNKDNYKNFIIGGFAGGISRSVTSPLEVIKVLQQNYPNTYGKQGILRILTDTTKNNGFKSFFKGNLTNCLRIVPQNAIQLSAFNYFNNHLNDIYPDKKRINSFNAGAIAGIISYTAIYPLELIRSKLSVNIDSRTKAYNNLGSALIQTYKNNGINGLYRGWIVSSIGMIPYQGITFLTYKYLDDKINITSSYKGLISGSFAGFAAVSATYPFDVIKRKYHLTGEMGNKSYNSYYDIIKTTYKSYGVRGFYRGLFACYSKIIPSSAIFFFTVDMCKNI
tara:strand:- start:443 stop:1276 length:834 start_codon:yes stop_codon:yes gene_type:complete